MSSRIKGFDGVRAIAVLLVFFQHKAGFGPGHLGVWMFFVLSGFLIAGILAKQRLSIESGASRYMRELSYFMFRRTIRIFPVYYLVLGFLSICVLIGFLGQEYRAGLPYHFAYLSNIWIGQIKQEWEGPFSHFWSLAIEEQFYLLFAPLLLATHVRRHWQICVIFILAGLSSLWFSKSAGAREILIYTHPLTNFWLFALGGLGYHLTGYGVASGRINMMHSFIPTAAAAAIIVLYASESSWKNGPGVYILAQACYGLCIAVLVCWIAGNRHSLLVSLLETRWLAALGRISYGFYLYHALVPSLTTGTRARMLFGDMGLSAWIYIVDVPLNFFITVILSWLSWRLIEKPILRLKERASTMETMQRHKIDALNSQA
ncbi:acyltransferase [Oxalobacteraceae bacterium R-40]|uniref:Acyltransferase n=1 Tax=Keguizhuia sedimenti TaxID=3064264 RepID=A0ABU1BU34_9BURK|nr:acyltransferase [Oxalobacteraceae bacterium R-40]